MKEKTRISFEPCVLNIVLFVLKLYFQTKKCSYGSDDFFTTKKVGITRCVNSTNIKYIQSKLCIQGMDKIDEGTVRGPAGSIKLSGEWLIIRWLIIMWMWLVQTQTKRGKLIHYTFVWCGFNSLIQSGFLVRAWPLEKHGSAHLFLRYFNGPVAHKRWNFD